MGKLKCLVLNHDFDIISISKTWWKNDNQCSIVILAYKLYRNGRVGHAGGRRALPFKDRIDSNNLKILSRRETTIELL